MCKELIEDAAILLRQFYSKEDGDKLEEHYESLAKELEELKASQPSPQVPEGYAPVPVSMLHSANHMAVSGDHLLDSINKYNEVFDEDGNELPNEDQHEAEERLSEAFGGMRTAIYEYRKRRDRAAPAPQQRELSDETVSKVADVIAEYLEDSYDCTRVWEAWSVGTMGQDDFVCISDQPERLDEIARAAILAAQPSTGGRQINADTFRKWFVNNYPVGTVIGDPAWHAEKIARLFSPTPPEGEL